MIDSEHLRMSVIEQRANMQFCVLLYISRSNTIRILEEAYDKVEMKTTQILECHKFFRDGRASVIDAQGLVRY
jgi:hypothetical protein